MSGGEGVPQDSGSTFGRIQHAVNRAYMRSQKAYRAYFDHSVGCDDCDHGGTRCEKAEELWRAYKDVQRNRR
ncbi:hypothetical protein [Streptomyces sp. NPDC048825]|uniref:hypothetical protein n=1 Tax=Streptomyces sp. NPDC048825 TaxID=3365592 RepID=UPI00371F5B63